MPNTQPGYPTWDTCPSASLKHCNVINSEIKLHCCICSNLEYSLHCTFALQSPYNATSHLSTAPLLPLLIKSSGGWRSIPPLRERKKAGVVELGCHGLLKSLHKKDWTNVWRVAYSFCLAFEYVHWGRWSVTKSDSHWNGIWLQNSNNHGDILLCIAL